MSKSGVRVIAAFIVGALLAGVIVFVASGADEDLGSNDRPPQGEPRERLVLQETVTGRLRTQAFEAQQPWQIRWESAPQRSSLMVLQGDLVVQTVAPLTPADGSTTINQGGTFRVVATGPRNQTYEIEVVERSD